MADNSKIKESIEATMTEFVKAHLKGMKYQYGTLKGGIAVLIRDTEAYWVKNGKIYAANGFAKMCSPGLSYSESGIDYYTIKKVVE